MTATLAAGQTAPFVISGAQRRCAEMRGVRMHSWRAWSGPVSPVRQRPRHRRDGPRLPAPLRCDPSDPARVCPEMKEDGHDQASHTDRARGHRGRLGASRPRWSRRMTTRKVTVLGRAGSWPTRWGMTPRLTGSRSTAMTSRGRSSGPGADRRACGHRVVARVFRGGNQRGPGAAARNMSATVSVVR